MSSAFRSPSASLVECLCLAPLRRVIEYDPFEQKYITVRLSHAPELFPWPWSETACKSCGMFGSAPASH
jgi:hypothetical protein